MGSIEEQVTDIQNRLRDEYNTSEDEIRELVEVWDGYVESDEQVKNGVIRKLAEKHDIDNPSKLVKTTESVTPVDSITEPDNWITAKGEILQLWDNDADSIRQVGLLGDETGRIKFTRWATDESEVQLEEGEVYGFESVVTGEFNDSMQLEINSNSSITHLNENLTIPDRENETLDRWSLVKISDRDGLIKKCVECDRKITDGECSEHGDVEQEFDLRIRGVIDNGEETKNLLLTSDAVEQMTGVTVEYAKELAKDKLDRSVIIDELRQELVPSYWVFTGFESSNGFVCTDTEQPDVEGTVGMGEGFISQIEQTVTDNNGDSQ